MTIHLFPNGQVERGAPRGKYVKGQGRITVPGYRWVPAYSQAVRPGVESMALPRREWQAMARRDGDKLCFHVNKQQAFAALRN